MRSNRGPDVRGIRIRFSVGRRNSGAGAAPRAGNLNFGVLLYSQVEEKSVGQKTDTGSMVVIGPLVEVRFTH